MRAGNETFTQARNLAASTSSGTVFSRERSTSGEAQVQYFECG
jgi:hypothetical protein